MKQCGKCGVKATYKGEHDIQKRDWGKQNGGVMNICYNCRDRMGA